jgi:hypothetical protein
MFHKVEHPMNGKVNDILTWLENDTQTIEDYDNDKTRIIFHASREGNTIEVYGTIYEINDASMPIKVNAGRAEGFKFEISKINDTRSLITGFIAYDIITHRENIFLEKLYFTYLARLLNFEN